MDSVEPPAKIPQSVVDPAVNPVSQSPVAKLKVPGVKRYTLDKMLMIWEDMDKTGIFRFSDIRRKQYYDKILPCTEIPNEDRIDYSAEAFKKRLEYVHSSPEYRKHRNYPSSLNRNTYRWEGTSLPDNTLRSSISEIPFSIPAVNNLVSPETIRWVYKDSSGIEQGPFDGLCMQEWYSEGWLEETLLIKRVEENDFYTLKEFVISVGNYLKPFLIPQASLSNTYHIETPSLVSPEHISWIYRDANGVEQGPFDGVRMQEWYSMKWLQDTLLIRRIEEATFYTIAQFVARLGNSPEPFLMPLPVNPALAQWNLHEQILISQRETLRAQQLRLTALQQQQQQLLQTSMALGILQEGMLNEKTELSKSEQEQKQMSLNRLRGAVGSKVKNREKSVQDFVDWCKESFKSLETSVDQADLLTRLLKVPLDDKENERSIICEAINKSSKTIDSNEFANDFIAKRGNLKAEDVLKKWTDTTAGKGNY